MELILISAMSRTRLIGAGEGMPWHLPDEYAQFLAHVDGHPIILGRRSYEIFGADLQSSPLLVVSRSLKAPAGRDVSVCGSFEEALTQASSLDPRVFVGGGGGIYAEALPHATALYLSTVYGDYEGDTYFPAFDETDWEITQHDSHQDFEFRIYQRR